MRVTLYDYGAGNLHSLAKSLEGGGLRVSVSEELRRALDTDVLILPGVGAFGAAAERMKPQLPALREALDKGLPCVGICLGMQLMFDASDEGAGEGIGYFSGRVTKLLGERVPHMGWNALEPEQGVNLPLRWGYYAHSYVCRPADRAVVQAWSTHEADRFPAIVRKGRVVGIQFHPEKSTTPGVAYLGGLIAEVAS